MWHRSFSLSPVRSLALIQSFSFLNLFLSARTYPILILEDLALILPILKAMLGTQRLLTKEHRRFPTVILVPIL